MRHLQNYGKFDEISQIHKVPSTVFLVCLYKHVDRLNKLMNSIKISLKKSVLTCLSEFLFQ